MYNTSTFEEIAEVSKYPMKEENTPAVEIALAQLELLADNAAQTLRALQAQLAVLRQGLTLLPITADAAEKKAPPLPSHAKDRSKWYLQGAWYNKRNFPLAVFQHYVEKQLTLDALDKMFSIENVYPQPILGNKKVFKLASDVSGNEIKRFHAEPIVTKDGVLILVTDQLGMNNFPQLIKYLAKIFNFPVKGKALSPSLWPHPPRAPFVEPNVTFLNT